MRADPVASSDRSERAGITASIVSHGHADYVRGLVAQLAALREPALVRVVLVHNLPDADVVPPEGADFELVQLHNPRPLGFAENHNLAFTYCDTRWFAVVNPDIDLVYGNPFPALLAAAEGSAAIGALAPALIDPVSRRPELHRGMVTPLELLRRRLPGWEAPTGSEWLVGAFVFLRAAAFRGVGGFDQRFRLYCEDVDLSVRLRLAGWGVERLDDCWVLHNKQQTSHRSLRYGYWHIQSLMRMWTSGAFRRYLRRGRTARRSAFAAFRERDPGANERDAR